MVELSESKAPIKFRSDLAAHTKLLYFALFFALAALPSCTPRMEYVQSPADLPGTFSSTGAEDVPDRWWTALGDSQLNRLVDQALMDNFSLRSAWDRLEQARAVAAKSASPLWPSADGSAGLSRTVRKSAGAPRLYSTEYSLGLTISYEVDLWGRVRSSHEAARLDVEATRQDLHSAAITLVAELAETWNKLIEQRGQLRLLDNQIKTNEDYLQIITLKFRRGQTSATDVLQQRQLVESTRGERVLVESSINVLDSQLSILLGQSPGKPTGNVPAKLPSLPPLPRTGLPAELVRRRPDVQAAELRVQAADRRLYTAIAEQFPKLDLTVATETTAERIRDLFDNWMASLAANLVAPIFDAGQRRAEVSRSRSVVSEQLNDYAQVVLNCLKEVEDALSKEAKQARYTDSLGRQLRLAEQSTAQTLANYTKGTMDFTRYLTTLLSYQRLQRTHLQAQKDLVLLRIGLYRALAGSWTLSAPPEASIRTPPAAPQTQQLDGPRYLSGSSKS